MGKKRQPPSDDGDDDEEEELNLEEFEESEEEEYDSDVRISSDFFFRLRAARIPTDGANAEQPKQPPLLSLSLSVFPMRFYTSTSSFFAPPSLSLAHRLCISFERILTTDPLPTKRTGGTRSRNESVRKHSGRSTETATLESPLSLFSQPE